MSSAAYQKKKEWVMNQEALDRLLGFLDTDLDAARRKYERIIDKLTNLFRWRSCPAPREYAAKTIEGAARELLEGEGLHVHNPYLYFHRVAINVSNALKEAWEASEKEDEATPKRIEAHSGGSSETDGTRNSGGRVLSPHSGTPVRARSFSLFQLGDNGVTKNSSEHEVKRLERERRLQCMRNCLSALPLESLELIAKYHRPGGAPLKQSRKELARSLGISQSELRLRVFRIRAGLMTSVNNCLGSAGSRSSGQNGVASSSKNRHG